jgi:ankyrin repeat protein
MGARAALVLLAVLTSCSQREDPLTWVPAGVEVEKRVFWKSDPNTTDAYGHSALHLAVFHGDAMLVRAVLAAGAHVDARDANGMTPLMIVAGTGACDIAQALLQAGADPNAANGPLHFRPVHLATFTGTPEMLGVLLDYGANPSAGDSWGRTPLHFLAQQDWVRAAALSRLLAAAGADLSAKDARGFTPLHVAAESDCVPMVDVYEERAPDLLGSLADTEVNALDVALEHEALLAADALFAAGVQPNDPTRQPPLLEAAHFDDRLRAEHVLALRTHPVDAYEGHTASEIARTYGSKGVLALLSAYGTR